MNESRIVDLEAKVAELTALVERLTTPAATITAAPITAAPMTAVDVAMAETSAVADVANMSSRRGMLKLAGAAAAGAVAVAVGGNAMPAAANGTNQALLIGVGTNTPTAPTDLTLLNGNFAAFSDSGTTSVTSGVNGTSYGFNTSTTADTFDRGGVLGVGSLFLGSGTATSHGVLGFAGSSTVGSAVYGRSDASVVGTSAGVRAKSLKGPSIQMVPVATGAPTTGTWAVGALQPDTTGRLFYCVVAGAPGTWIDLTSNPIALNIINPVRVFDSRLALPSQGKLQSGSNKVVSIKDARDTTTGAVTVADVVPAGAAAVVGNITVTNTVGNGGFLAVVPGDATGFSASSINWFGPGQNIANGITAKIAVADRSVKVFCGGGNPTDFIIDISGYYI